MSNTNSNLMANFVADPRVHNEVTAEYGRKRSIADQFEVDSADLTDTDVIHLCAIPSNARILSILLANDDLAATALAADVGLRNEDLSQISAAIDSVFDADSTQLQAAVAGPGTEQRYIVPDINTRLQKAWELAGLAEDPGGHLVLCMPITTSAGTPASGTLSFDVEIVVD